MGASKEEIHGWLKRGIQKKATHVISVCDTFDNSDYPVFVMPLENAREVAQEYGKKSMQRVNEVYHLGMDIEMQLAEDRAFHYDLPDLEAMNAKPEHNPPTVEEETRLILADLQAGRIGIDDCMIMLNKLSAV